MKKLTLSLLALSFLSLSYSTAEASYVSSYYGCFLTCPNELQAEQKQEALEYFNGTAEMPTFLTGLSYEELQGVANEVQYLEEDLDL